jgi:hypothetical protein
LPGKSGKLQSKRNSVKRNLIEPKPHDAFFHSADEAFLPGEAGKLQAKRRKLNLKLRKLHLNLQLSTKVVRDTNVGINVILGPLTKLTKRLKYLCVIAGNKCSTHELKEDFKVRLELRCSKRCLLKSLLSPSLHLDS